MPGKENILKDGSIAAYNDWFASADHGDTIVYFVGDLMSSRERLASDEALLSSQERIDLIRLDTLADRVRVDGENGFTALTQQRLGDHRYAYRATRLKLAKARAMQAQEQSDHDGI